jgi:sulfur-oxidizing protein SoxZ
METGLRRTGAGDIVPRKIINKFTCFYNDEAVFSVDLHEAVAANPFVAFYVAATESGRLKFVWEEDGGAIFSIEKPITVEDRSGHHQINPG